MGSTAARVAQQRGHDGVGERSPVHVDHTGAVLGCITGRDGGVWRMDLDACSGGTTVTGERALAVPARAITSARPGASARSIPRASTAAPVGVLDVQATSSGASRSHSSRMSSCPAVSSNLDATGKATYGSGRSLAVMQSERAEVHPSVAASTTRCARERRTGWAVGLSGLQPRGAAQDGRVGLPTTGGSLCGSAATEASAAAGEAQSGGHVKAPRRDDAPTTR
jgi:hypothetical protein